MEQYIKLFDLNEDQARAVERFHEYHRSCEAHAGGGKASNRPLEWHLGYELSIAVVPRSNLQND